MTVAEARALRSGLPYWWRSYLLLVRWELTSLRLLLAVMIAIQTLSGVGVVFAISLWFDAVPPVVAIYATTGGSAVTLAVVGLVLGPQLVAQQKAEQTYDFLWSLPAPRSASAAAWLTINLAVSLPAMVATLIIGSAVHDFDLDVSSAIVPAVLLAVYTATMTGYALAHALSSPVLVSLITQVLIFVLFGFSPMLFPPENLPGWLEAANEWLPFGNVAVVVRAGLTHGLVGGVGHAYAVLLAWAAASTAVAAAVLGRRP